MTYITCKFCNAPQVLFKGVIRVDNSGKETYFCSRRCRIHTLNKRNLKR